MARSGRGSKLPPDDPVLFDLPLGLPEEEPDLELQPPPQQQKPRAAAASTGSAGRVPRPAANELLPFEFPSEAQSYPRAVPSPRSGTPIEEEEEELVAASVPSVFPSGRERWIAGAADLVVHAAVLVVALIGVRALGIHPALQHAAPFGLFLASFSFLYTVIPLAFWGQTLGMGWMRTIARDRDGQALTFDQTARRWLGGLIVAGLLGLPVWLARRGRSLTDWLSGSITLRANGADSDTEPGYGAA
ncbi:MAG TPA: RDD family protein [Thermoanaerobaculia bacterium]|nr:RDD family protein [Thermoanaerobaculia bacterium]